LVQFACNFGTADDRFGCHSAAAGFGDQTKTIGPCGVLTAVGRSRRQSRNTHERICFATGMPAKRSHSRTMFTWSPKRQLQNEASHKSSCSSPSCNQFGNRASVILVVLTDHEPTIIPGSFKCSVVREGREPCGSDLLPRDADPSKPFGPRRGFTKKRPSKVDSLGFLFRRRWARAVPLSTAKRFGTKTHKKKT